MQKFILFYLLSEDLEKTRKSLGRHISYWKGLELDSMENGPFADRSGGLILFTAEDLAAAQAIVDRDPLLTEGACRQFWLKEWVS